MSVELATAYISLVPETSKIAPGVKKALGGVERDAEKSGQSWGSKLAGGIGKTMKAGAVVAGGAVAGVLGTALVKGFGRLNAIDQAEAKLRGLGHSAEGVTGIMQNALASVKGTAFGLGDAATVAASTVAAGIKPGKELERVLKLTGDAATIAGTGIAEMGSVFNKVAASNRLSMAEVNQLSDRGVPIMQMLADQYGVTAAEARKMVEQGKVDFADFSQAIEDNIGGAALESGSTFQGALANMGAALGRLGASLLGGVFPQIKDGFGDITGALDNLGPVAEKVGEKVGAALAWMVDAGKGLFDMFVKGDFSESFRKAFNIEEDSGVVGFLLGLRETAIDTFNEIKGGITAFAAAWKANDGDVTSSGFAGVMERLANLIRGKLIPAFVTVGKWLVDNKETVAAFAATIGTLLVVNKVTKAVKAFGLMLKMTPFGMIVTAIALLVAGLVWLYQNNETARRIIDAAWAAIKTAISAVVDWLVGTAWPFIKRVWDLASEGAVQLWGYMKTAWDGIYGAVSAVVSWLTGTAWPFVKGVFDKIGAAVEFLYVNFIRPQWRLIQLIIESFVNWAVNTAWPWLRDKVFGPIGEGAKKLYEGFIKPAWDNIKRGIDAVVGWLVNTAWPAIKSAWDNIASGAKWLWDNGIKPPFDRFKEGLDVIVGAVRTARDAIGTAWSAIKDKISGPLSAAMSWINKYFIDPVNSLMKKLGMTLQIPRINVSGSGAKGVASKGGPAMAFASGGVLPGYSPGRDDHWFTGPTGTIGLSGGEAIMRPEWTRAVGAGFVNAMNRIAATSGVAGVRKALGGGHAYAGGGVIDWIKKKGTDIIDIASQAWKVISDPKKALEDFVARALRGIGDAPLVQAAAQVARKVAGAVASKIADWAGGGGGGDRAGNGMGWRAMQAWFESAFPGKKITSGYRPGARSVTGIVSDHALGRAIDMPPSMAIFNAIDRTWKNIRQLLYSPAGPRQIRGGRRMDTTGALRAQHWDHVHWAMARGGIVKPFVADSGVTLAPGINVVHNKLGRPEPLARTDQMPERMEIAGTLDLGDGMTAALRGVADFTQMGGLRSRMAAGVRS